MEVIVDVIIEMGSILLMEIVCFAQYVNGKLFLIKIGLIGVTANVLFELDTVSDEFIRIQVLKLSVDT